jgi:pimeloyl-ACP methyl ester carboxylesterase
VYSQSIRGPLGYFVAGVPGAIAGWAAMATPALLIVPLVHFVGRRMEHPRVKGVLHAVVIASVRGRDQDGTVRRRRRLVQAYPHDLPVLHTMLPQVQTPVLVVAGSDDPIVPPANQKWHKTRQPLQPHEAVGLRVPTQPQKLASPRTLEAWN